MIVPWLDGILDYRRAPFTWMLIALNVFVFLMMQDFQRPNSSSRQSQNRNWLNEPFIKLTGKNYFAYSNQETKEEELILKIRKMSDPELLRWGARGLRDPQFLKIFESSEAKSLLKGLSLGDTIENQKWFGQMQKFREELQSSALTIFGFTSEGFRHFSVVTYQFMHASWIHLLGNMLMLLIFAAAIEKRWGGTFLLALYVVGGIGAAMVFHLISLPTAAPMVGASGSLSALIGYYTFREFRRRVSFFFFFSPLPQHHGWIYLPKFLLLPLCFASDLAAFLASSPELGSGVAYGAHLGGLITGALIAGLSILIFKLSAQFRPGQNLGASYFPSHTENP